MKITSLLFAVAVGMTIDASSQIYIAPGVGYGLPANRQTLMYEYRADSVSQTESGVFASMGTGIMPQLIVGYKLCDRGSVEVGFNYLVNSKVNAEYRNQPSPGYDYSKTEQMRAQGMRVTIGGRLECEEHKLKPFIRAAVVLGFGNKLTYSFTQKSTKPSSTSTMEFAEEFDGGLAIGFNSGFGVTYPVNDKLAVYAEGFFMSLSWAPTHSVYTEYTLNGQDMLTQMNTYDKEANYYNSVSYTGGPTVANEPSKEIKYYYPMSSVGVNVGIHITLGQQ